MGAAITLTDMKKVLVIGSVLLWAATSLHADLIDEVTPDQLTQLKSGQVVVNSADVPNFVWPKLTLFKVVNATPAQMMALFADYKSAPSYTPNMISAEVTAEPKPGVKNVKYTVKVPVLGTISYDVENTFSKNNVTWNLIQSPLAKSSTGSLRVEPYGNNQTLFSYTNLVEPMTKMASVLKGQARTEAVNTINAIAAEAQKRAGN